MLDTVGFCAGTSKKAPLKTGLGIPITIYQPLHTFDASVFESIFRCARLHFVFWNLKLVCMESVKILMYVVRSGILLI